MDRCSFAVSAKEDPDMAEPADITIVGSGLAGALLACYLGRDGFRVTLYEKRADPRSHQQDRGRSINLALSVRGLHALRDLGLADAVLADAIPMRGRMMHARTGQLTFQPYGTDPSDFINSVSRAGLNLALVRAAAKYDTVRLLFCHRCTGLDLATNSLELHDAEQDRTVTVPCQRILGADGAYSAVRAALQHRERFNYSQEYLSHGYKELTIPPGPDGTHRMEKNALHIWPRQSFMMIALPNADGSFTCTLFYPYDGPESFAALKTEQDVRRFFEEQFPDAVPLLPNLVEEFFHNPTGPLLTVRCQPWHHDGRVVLIGDACHAVVPFLGQGMNAAFEDCTVLTECLRQHLPDWEKAFSAYEQQRKEHTDTLADLAVQNFIEMRDKVGSRLFLLRKKAELLLHRLLPRWYLPLYHLVTFTRTPYADAVRRVRRQERVVLGVGIGVPLLLLLLALLLAWR
jgi:kynurenine 3-monooxygenase